MRAKILNASAGSGKTYQLAYNYVREVIVQPTIYRHILAVTFTNKATEEMKSRILKEIHRLASDYKSPYREELRKELGMSCEEIRRRATEARAHILHDYSRFTVLTIDTFFQRILRAFIKELGLDLNYNIELETATLLTKSADTLIEQITTDQALLKWMTRFVEERIEEGKSWDVREGVLALGDEIFKEKNKEVLTASRSREELGKLIEESSRTAAKTKAEVVRLAKEAMAIIDQAGATVEDFPYKYGGFASWFYTIARDQEVQPYKVRVVKACEEDAAWGKPNTLSASLRPQLQPILVAMRTLYDRNVRRWNTCALLRETYRSFALLGDLYDKVQNLCKEQQLMLLSETKHLLAEFVTELDAPFIYEKVGNRFERFMIDEFQDTSVKEWENFLPLLRNAMAQSEKQAVLLVGDIKQSIYRWRGSDWKILHSGAEQALGQTETRVEVLRSNFRSLPEIVNFNNRIIEELVELDNSILNAQLKNAVLEHSLESETAAKLIDTLKNAYHESAQEPRRRNPHTGYVSVSRYQEEPPIVERICALIDLGYHPSDIMILVRKSSEGATIATRLLDFKRENQDPRYRFDVMTQEALIIGSAPISSFVTACLRLALNDADSISRALYNQYRELAFDRELTSDERDFFRSIRLLSPEEAFERIVLQYELQHRREETAYLQALHEQILSFSTNRIADIALFLGWWDEQGATRSLSVEESQTTIEITTIHKAKGLEKKVILIPYCMWSLDPKASGTAGNVVWAEAADETTAAIGRVPIRFKKLMGESGFSAAYFHELVYSHVDNINLLYVALTRAKESLHIFIPEKGEKHIGALLWDLLSREKLQTEYTFGTLQGPAPHDERREEPYEEQQRCEEPQPRREHILLEHYPTSPASMQLSLPSERYFEAEKEQELSPRNFGILMHKAFEAAQDRQEIGRAIEQMLLDGILSEVDKLELEKMVAAALTHDEVGGWFDGSWDEVRCEEDIICPQEQGIRRPDRVMIRGKRAVVVDYKFGELNAASYRTQIKRYCQLLSDMGYTELSGYLWYVKLGKIEKVI
ncbi:MAG: UvrD-helicase domain-containing protein [Rikenellaceae bacterium]|nr:UvrD-helicase domain-containing protein [Rikenellaceae bacterium]